MGSEDREQGMKALNARVSRSRRPRPLRNVLERVAAVLAGQEVLYVDNDLRDDDVGGGISGRITVFTNDVVAIVNVAGAAANVSLGASLDQGTAKVTFLPRASLAALEIPPNDGTYPNSGEAWSTEAARNAWPHGGVMHLRYNGLSEPLVLPAGDSGEDFHALLPSLVTDLSR
jgi:hypothetical protein